MIYKVNTEEEQELASVFGIQSIPTILFIPKEGQPQAAMGALPKQTFEKAIKDILLKN
jgi:thioredoxin-like negative regulator of GroEL